MSDVKHIITKKIFKLSGAENLGIKLSSGGGSYNEKENPTEVIKFCITKETYICSLIYNRRTEGLRAEPPIIYQYLVNENRNIDFDDLLDNLKKMVLICEIWMNEPQYYGLHELILIQRNGILNIIDNSSH